MPGFRADLQNIRGGISSGVPASMVESHGISIIEALFSGRTVQSDDTEGIAELPENNGNNRPVPEKKPGVLAEGIISLIGDKALRDRCHLSAEERAKKFSVGSVVEKPAGCIGKSMSPRYENRFYKPDR